MNYVQPLNHDQAFLQRVTAAGIPIKSVYDIGASNGQWSERSVGLLPEATFELFEPWPDSPQYAETMEANLRQYPNFRLHRFALGRESSTLRLHVQHQHVGNSLIESSWDGIVDRRPVPVRRLDDAVADLDIPLPDLIKIDVQGFELKILDGGEQTCRHAKVLMIESWFYRGYGPDTPLLHEVIDWVDERQFTLVTLGEASISPELKMYTVDAFFVRNDVLADAAARGEKLDIVNHYY